MASAAASRPPPRPPPPPHPTPPPPLPPSVQWLSPRVSFSLDDAGGGGGGGGGGSEAAPGKTSADFEFLLAGCSVAPMLPADELFSGGKLVPLCFPPPTSSTPTAAVATPPPGQAVHTIPAAAETSEESKIPARRWKDLLRLRKQQASSPDSKPLRCLLRRSPKPPVPEPTVSLPLLHDADPNKPDKPEKATPTWPTPTPTPAQHQLPTKIRLSPAPAPLPPPPPPPTVAAESPRLNAAGKVVFNGLGRSSSSPSSLAGGRAAAGRHGDIERSYSAHVRVSPVLNVPVCSLRGPRKPISVFGIDRLFSPAASAATTASSSASKKGKAVKKDVTTK